MYYVKEKEKEKERASEMLDVSRPPKVKTPPISFKTRSERLDWAEVGKRLKRQSEANEGVLQGSLDDKASNVDMDVDKIASTDSGIKEALAPDEDSQPEKEEDFVPICMTAFNFCRENIYAHRQEVENARERYGMLSVEYRDANKKYEAATEQFDEWKEQFETAIRYLEEGSPTARKLLNVVTQSQEILDEEVKIHIRFNDEHRTQYLAFTRDEGQINLNKRIVEWDPTAAFVFENNSDVMSPAMTLVHEFSHVAQHLQGCKAFAADLNDRLTRSPIDWSDADTSREELDRRWDLVVAMENEAIEQWDNKIANELGEPEREGFTGAGTTIRVGCPTDWGHMYIPSWNPDNFRSGPRPNVMDWYNKTIIRKK
ncbi:MAG: M91 family zinc metallopeptidase [Defluviitaleaceae bacterium]|nr:M91 family zinc metallopeptidase [Defluviitaleaceae bacterium]